MLVLAVSLLVAAAPGKADAGPADGRSLYYARVVTPADLAGRSLRELTLMRNVIYARAGNPFRRKWLHDYFAQQPWYVAEEVMDDSRVTELDTANAEAIAAYESALTSAQLLEQRDLVRARVKAAGKATEEQLIELKLLSVRLGGWAGEGDPPANLSALEDPRQLDRLLTLKELDDFSPRDLKLLRNTIFARWGRAFVTPLVKGHFSTVTWYQADPKYTDQKLTPVDLKNVQLIASVEKQIKRSKSQLQSKDGPPDGWYGAA